MNKLTKRVFFIGLCAALIIGCTCAVSALDRENPDEAVSEETAPVTETNDETLSKDETVYVLSDANGSVQKIIVSDWLKNEMGASTVEDISDLTDIENVKGDESYTVSGNAKVWDMKGNDVYYQGNIEKELPVNLSVTYKLDGNAISADQLAGKSGKVTIRFDYDNCQYEMVNINGKQEKIYVPFAMLTGMLLDSDHFRNVEVSNGKLLNDGDRTAVIGIAFPGLQENLGIDKDKIDIPDYVEITADVTDFSSGITVTLAANDLFNDLETLNFDSVEDLTGSIDELSDGMQQLLDGSSALYDGLCTLLDKSDELVQGINQLADGAKEIKTGAETLDDGVGELQSGAADLSKGLGELKRNNTMLTGGAKQVFDTLLATAETQIKAAGIPVSSLTIQNYADVLNGIISSLDKSAVYSQALAQVTAEVEKNRPLIVEKVTAAVQEQVEIQVTATVKEQVTNGVTAAIRDQVTSQVIQSATGMSPKDYEAAVNAGLVTKETQDAINEAIEAQMVTDEIQVMITSRTDSQMESDKIKEMIAAETKTQMAAKDIQSSISAQTDVEIEKAISENMASDAVQSQLESASEGAKSIIALKASLDDYNAFYLGLITYTDGVATAADGAATLSSGLTDLKGGTEELKAGTATLCDGILQIQNGIPTLLDGITQLKDGAMQLSDGLKQLDEEGIQEIVDLIGNDLEGGLERLDATVNVSKNYRNFSGISDDMDGQVKFIYRTDEIKAQE